MTPARDRERISALTAGLAATIIIWIFTAGYAPETLEKLGDYSPWLYGPISTAMWAVFSALAYLLIRRGRQNSAHHVDETYRCRELVVPTPVISTSVCASRREKNHLAAVTAGFALTMTAWVATLSLIPYDWINSISTVPPWLYCLGSVAFWAASSTAMYSIFSAADHRRDGRKTS